MVPMWSPVRIGSRHTLHGSGNVRVAVLYITAPSGGAGKAGATGAVGAASAVKIGDPVKTAVTKARPSSALSMTACRVH